MIIFQYTCLNIYFKLFVPFEYVCLYEIVFKYFADMKTRVTFEYLLKGTCSEISRYFSDFHLFGKHHPYMVEVTDLGTDMQSNELYRVHESLKLWNIIPMKPCYDVKVIILEPSKHIQYKSEVSKGVFLTIDYTFLEDTTTSTVKVVEAMDLTGYPVINTIFIGLLKKSRRLLIESIQKELTKKHAV